MCDAESVCGCAKNAVVHAYWTLSAENMALSRWSAAAAEEGRFSIRCELLQPRPGLR